MNEPAPSSLPDNTPIIIGVGQSMEQSAPDSPLSSPAELAAQSSQAALDDAGLQNADCIDTIAVVRLFSDSPGSWECPFGRSNNLPQSIAQRIGADPQSRIYSELGGHMPQQLVTEMAQAIADGTKSTVLLAGAEAIGHQKYARRNNIQSDWNENYDQELEDRGHGKNLVTHEEVANGLWMPIYYYSLIENALARRLGRDTQQHRTVIGELMAPLSKVAANNPYAQFPKEYRPEQLASEGDGNYQLTIPYLKNVVSQDAVNQGASLLLTSVGEAKRLGVPLSNWVYLHGFAQGYDHPLMLRPELDKSAAQVAVIEKTLNMAGLSTEQMDLFEIYSCFPCAVSTVADALGLPKDGSVPLTVTGGLPFFGGAGNNYSMHGIAEMIVQLRKAPESYGLVTTNGGFLSKHACGVYSCQPSGLDWGAVDSAEIRSEDLPGCEIAQKPGAGIVLSYTVVYARGEPRNAFIIGEADDGNRFVASSVDIDIISSFETESPIGSRVDVSTNGDTNSFSLSL